MLVALALAKHLPNVETTVVRSTKLGVIGVGEGTIASIGRFLHDYLGIDPLHFHQEVHPSIKLGIQFQWGSDKPFHYTFSNQFSAPLSPQVKLSLARGYYCSSDASYADSTSALMFHGKAARLDDQGNPLLCPRYAYHLENKRFVGFLEKHSDELGVKKVDAIVEEVSVDERGVKELMLDNGEKVSADLFVDCSGFRSALLGEALQEPFVSFKDALLCDRAVVGGWQRTDDEYFAYTRAEAMDSGWCWQIEHDEIINRGYVYASDFISDEQAEKEFRQRNPKLGETRVVKFRSGVYRRAWVKNVVAIGNSYGFVEPLEATAIGLISSAANELVTVLKSGGDCITDASRDVFNKIQDVNWQQTRDFLAFHYKPNQLSQSPFWDACRNDVDLGDAQEILDYYQAVGPDLSALQHRMKSDLFGTEGYLAMLVGQNVPYRRQVEVSDNEKMAWTKLRGRLAQFADAGIGMSEYLSKLRQGQASLPMPRMGMPTNPA